MWKDIIQRMLPPIGGIYPHDTSRFGALRKKGTSPHAGVDSNYNVGPNGQTGINLTHPALRSPVTGIVTNAGQGTAGRIAIRDANGYSNELLHTHRRYVAVGDPVVAGQLVGTMGNTGVDVPGVEGSDHHLHTQLKDPAGRVINPTEHFDQQGPVDPNPVPPALLQEYQEYLRAVGANAGDARPMSPNMSAPFGTAGQFAPGSATSSRPLYETRSFVDSVDGPSTPARGKDFRYVSRRTPDQPQTTYVMAPMFPPNEIPAVAPASFADRFGDWVSLPEVDAARIPQQPRQQEQATRPLGIFSGKPMPDYTFPPPIWGFPDDLRGIGKEDWTLRRLKPADWKKAR